MNDGNITCDTCGGTFPARHMRGHACSGNPTPQQPGPREFWLCDMRGPDAIARADEWNQNMEVFVVKPKFSDVIHVREVTPGPFREFALYPTGNGGWRSVLNDERTQAYGNVVYTVERSALTACEAKLAEALATSEHRYKWAMAVQAKWGSAEAQLQAERERKECVCDPERNDIRAVVYRKERDEARAEVEAYKGLLGYSVSSENPPPEVTARNVIADSLRAEAERLQAGHARMSDIAKEQAEVIRLLWLVAEAAKIDTLPRNNELIAALFELEAALAGEGGDADAKE